MQTEPSNSSTSDLKNSLKEHFPSLMSFNSRASGIIQSSDSGIAEYFIDLLCKVKLKSRNKIQGKSAKSYLYDLLQYKVCFIFSQCHFMRRGAFYYRFQRGGWYHADKLGEYCKCEMRRVRL